MKLWIRQFYSQLVILSHFILILHWNKINHNTLTVLFEKSRTVSFNSSIVKKIVALFFRFPLKLICCIYFGTASNFCYLFKSIAYNVLLNEDSLVNSQLCNYPFNQLQFFECYHMLVEHFFIGFSEKFLISFFRR